jgi:hypothetical protein
MRIYSHDTKGVPDPGASRSIRCNVPGDLLRYEPAEGGQSLREFLSTSLRRLEDGLRIYTYTENDCLLCYGWLVERQEKALVSEVGQEFSLPPNSAGLFDFFEFPQARGRGLFSSLLRVMLHDAARIPGTARTFVFVSADDAPLRQAIEEVGFSYECSLFEHVRLGRTRRWVQLPGAGEVHPSFRAV